jgi:PAS domain S-box-containing protein
MYPLSYGEEELWFKATLSLHDDGESIVAVVRDVTDERRAERAVRDSERKYRMLYENIPEGFSRVDLEGNYFESNEAYLDIIGYSQEELEGLSYFDLTPEEFHEEEKRIHEEEVIRRGYSDVYEKEYRRKDGSLVPVEIHIFLTRDEEGNPTGTWSIVRDITERKEVEDKLRYQASLLDLITDAVITTDTEWVVKSWNQAAEKMYGWTSEEVVGKTLDHFLETKYVNTNTEDAIKELYETNLWSGEVDQTCKDGSQISVLSSVSLIRDNEGNVIGSIGVNRDITDRKEAEDALRRKNKELSEFAHSMSHDLRGSFHNLLGYAELLKEKYSTSMVDKITLITHRMQDLLKRSVELADAGLVVDTDQQVNLSFLVRSIADTIIPDGVSFESDRLPIIFGDQDKIGQMISNIFTNAIEHGDPKNIEVRLKESDSEYNLYFINDGKGIDDDMQKKVFDQGFTTKRQGRGLGLTIVQRIVNAHGWDIELEDGFPTIFKITIPKEQ